MSKREKLERELSAAKYCAGVALRRAEESKRMDRLVVLLLAASCAVFALALVLAGVIA